MYPIKYIFFDFGGTLAYEGNRNTFINGNSLKKRLSVLYPDTINTLQYLKKKGIKMGIISNTSWSRHDMYNAFQKNNLLQFFDCLYYSSDLNTCAKPCSKIFLNAIKCSGYHPKNILYVGNNYFKDIIGPKKIGLQTAYITNNNQDPITKNVIKYGVQTYTMNRISGLKQII